MDDHEALRLVDKEHRLTVAIDHLEGRGNRLTPAQSKNLERFRAELAEVTATLDALGVTA